MVYVVGLRNLTLTVRDQLDEVLLPEQLAVTEHRLQHVLRLDVTGHILRALRVQRVMAVLVVVRVGDQVVEIPLCSPA
jgi:hypothetical protein